MSFYCQFQGLEHSGTHTHTHTHGNHELDCVGVSPCSRYDLFVMYLPSIHITIDVDFDQYKHPTHIHQSPEKLGKFNP